LSLGVDLIAVSFVQNAEDLRRARRLILDANGGDVPLVAKLERPQAIADLDGILGSCQAVMVARGDLGLEMPLERVPRAQKDITRAARLRGIPVIVATQVFESMTTESRPTRAEVNDAAGAVADGVDAIMLAGETAVGAHAAKAVETLDRVIRAAEEPALDLIERRRMDQAHHDHTQALCEAAVTLAGRADAAAIVAVTRGGTSARRLSALRPHAPIVATTERSDMARRLALYWGVVPLCMAIGDNLDEANARICRRLLDDRFVDAGASVVLVSINPDLSRAHANYLQIQHVTANRPPGTSV
jgi:pyruvate kinase